MSQYGDTMIITSSWDLGRAVRRGRQRRGWSQDQVAGRAGVSRQWIVALEGGKPRVELDAVLRTLAALDLAIDLVEAPPLHGVVDLDAIAD